MPEDIPKAVMILIWLMVGVIIFGALLWEAYVPQAFIFAVVFYGIPVFVYTKFFKDSGQTS